jgi:tetratricopeptide (TPR) repeat protein
MYGEAYLEILRIELSKDQKDPKLQKLRQDIIPRTKRKLLKQAKVNPDDTVVFTILADIAFHQNNLDDASTYISKAINNNPNAISRHVFAKILFKKGNITQSFEQMSLALEESPDSPVIFADFQFLYSCKSYGINSAKKICKNKNFLRRAKPIAEGDAEPTAPPSPFENDPTEPPDTILPPAAIDDSPTLPDEKPQIADAKINIDDQPEDDDEIDLPDLEDLENLPASTPAKTPPRPVPNRPRPVAIQADSQITEIDDSPDDLEEDPEQKNIEKAEYLLKQAEVQFKEGKYEDSELNLQKIAKLTDSLPGKDELSAKLEKKKKLLKRYKEAVAEFEKDKFNNDILQAIEQAWNEEPSRTVDAPFMIGKIYLLKNNPDKQKAIEYFNIVLNEPDGNDERKRDLEWTKIQILMEIGNYKKAQQLFWDFFEREESYVKNRDDYWTIRYEIFFQLYRIYILIAIGIALSLFLIVFMLQLLPAVSFSLFDPIKGSKKAFKNGNFTKAANLAEKVLQKEQPIQIERELLEILVQSHFELLNYVKCQENARYLLEKFPENNIAWSYLAKASIASQDTTDEAINMYESIYKEKPENSEYLPILAKHYATKQIYTLEAMEIMFTYFQANPENTNVIEALAHGYVQNKTMGEEVITVLQEALKHKTDITFRELLARNYSKAGMYQEAARECILVLQENINNMGIHVVYSSSMKKLNLQEEAIAQYEQFLQDEPDNPQLQEILAGLKKEFDQTPSVNESFEPALSLPDDIDGLQEPSELPTMDIIEDQSNLISSTLPMDDSDIEGFTEPPPEGFSTNENSEIPIPDFLRDQEIPQEDSEERPLPAGIENLPEPELPEPGLTIATEISHDQDESLDLPGLSNSDDLLDLPTLDPFDDNDSLLRDLGTELPEELGGPSQLIEPMPEEPLSSMNTLYPEPPKEPAINETPSIPIPEALEPATELPTSKNETFGKLSEAREKAKASDWSGVIETLSPVFASERSKDVGILLSQAHLSNNEPILAMEIIETVDFDPELMGEDLKDVLYQIGVALESAKKYTEALKMYDLICNVDINYKDAFDRSDKLYSK